MYILGLKIKTENGIKTIKKENDPSYQLEKQNAQFLIKIAELESDKEKLTSDHAALLMELTIKGVI